MKKFLFVALLGALSCIMAADGSAIYRKCIACHGKAADLKYMNKVPPLATLTKEFMIKSMEEYKAGTNNKYKTGILMKGQMAKLSKEDIEAVATYISTNFKKK